MTTNWWFLQLSDMSFHVQVNNISAFSITSHLIKKPEKYLGFNDVGSGIWKLCIPLSSILLAMPLCFIAEGYYCLLPYLRQELILYRRVNGLRTSILWIWLLDIKQILCFIHFHKVLIWIARRVEIFSKKWQSNHHQFMCWRKQFVYFFRQEKTTNKANWSEVNRNWPKSLEASLDLEDNSITV